MTEENKDLRLSVSKTKTFADCKKKFKYNYIERLPKKEWDFHIYGKFVHRVLELYHLHYLKGGTSERHISMMDAFKESCVEFKGKMTPEQRVEAKLACSAYLKKLSEEPLDQVPNITGVEKEFSINIADKICLLGVIDRVQIDADGVPHVCDYKTTKNKKYLKNDWFQLLTYAYVMYMQDPTITKVRGSYILIRHGFEYITATFDLPQILAIKDKFLKYAEDMEAEKLFRANPTPLCKYCDFLENCDEGRQFTQRDTYFGKTSW